MDNKELIKKAASFVHARKSKDYLIGDVACALETKAGNIHVGVCASLDSNTFCAEKIAIGTMLTHQESEIKSLVAVWKDEKGKTFVIPPCGNCRELIKQVNPDNLNSRIILDLEKDTPLKELLPYHDWWKEVSI